LNGSCGAWLPRYTTCTLSMIGMQSRSGVHTRYELVPAWSFMLWVSPPLTFNGFFGGDRWPLFPICGTSLCYPLSRIGPLIKPLVCHFYARNGYSILGYLNCTPSFINFIVLRITSRQLCHFCMVDRAWTHYFLWVVLALCCCSAISSIATMLRCSVFFLHFSSYYEIIYLFLPSFKPL